jgi:hypothetical protein
MCAESDDPFGSNGSRRAGAVAATHVGMCDPTCCLHAALAAEQMRALWWLFAMHAGQGARACAALHPHRLGSQHVAARRPRACATPARHGPLHIFSAAPHKCGRRTPPPHTHTHANSCSAALGSPVKASATAVLPQCPQQFSCLFSPPPHYPIGQQGWWFPTRRPPSSFHRFAACLLGPPPQVKRYRFARNKRRPAASFPPAHNNWPPPHPSVSSLCTAGAPPAPYAHHPGPHTTRPPPFSAAPSWPATAGPGRWPGAPPAGTPAG